LITNKLSAFGVSVVVAFAAVLVLLVASPLTASADKGTATAKVVTIPNSTVLADQAILVKSTHVSGKAACSEGTMSSVANKTVGGAVSFAQIACGTTSTTVSIQPTTTATSITVASTTGFPDSGSILIGNGTGGAIEEILDYTSKTKTTIDGLTRARAGTVAVAHAAGVSLYPVIYSQIQGAAGVVAATSTTIELTDGSGFVFDTAGAQVIFSPGANDDPVVITGRTGSVITHAVSVGAHAMGAYIAQISGANTDSATATFARTASTTTTGSFQFIHTITAGAAQASLKADVEITLITDKPVATAAAATVSSTDVVAIPVIVSLNGTDDTEVSTGAPATQFFTVTVLPLKGVLTLPVSPVICTNVGTALTRVVGAVMTNCASTVVYTPLIGATGSDSFTFTLTQGGEVSAAQTATITLPAAPVAVVAPTLTGGFATTVSTGVNLTTYGGGTVAELDADGVAAGATSISVTVDGAYVVYVVGAPEFVNAAFNAQFPTSVPNGTVVLVVK